jgi:hypothetical protein
VKCIAVGKQPVRDEDLFSSRISGKDEEDRKRALPATVYFPKRIATERLQKQGNIRLFSPGSGHPENFSNCEEVV